MSLLSIQEVGSFDRGARPAKSLAGLSDYVIGHGTFLFATPALTFLYASVAPALLGSRSAL
jgi:hypothetical protein